MKKWQHFNDINCFSMWFPPLGCLRKQFSWLSAWPSQYRESISIQSTNEEFTAGNDYDSLLQMPVLRYKIKISSKFKNFMKLRASFFDCCFLLCRSLDDVRNQPIQRGIDNLALKENKTIPFEEGVISSLFNDATASGLIFTQSLKSLKYVKFRCFIWSIRY